MVYAAVYVLVVAVQVVFAVGGTSPLHGLVTMGDDLKPDALALGLIMATLGMGLGAAAYVFAPKWAGTLIKGGLGALVLSALVGGSMIPWVQAHF